MGNLGDISDLFLVFVQSETGIQVTQAHLSLTEWWLSLGKRYVTNLWLGIVKVV